MRTLTAVLLAGAMLATGCSGSSTPHPSPPHPRTPHTATAAPSDVPSAATSTPAGPRVETLPLGKADLDLAAGTTYLSPAGFRPALRITVPGDGWNSTHRGPDAFDMGLAAPGTDAALVVVAFVVPPETSTGQALAAIGRRATDAGATVARTGNGGLRVSGGEGPLVASRDASIALDAVPGGYTVIRADERGGPLLTVSWVPDATSRGLADRRSGELTRAVTRA